MDDGASENPTEREREGYKSRYQQAENDREEVPGQCCHEGFSAAFDLTCDAGVATAGCAGSKRATGAEPGAADAKHSGRPGPCR